LIHPGGKNGIVSEKRKRIAFFSAATESITFSGNGKEREAQSLCGSD
jgi:hypothetical protein